MAVAPPSPLRTFRILAGALMGAVVVIGVALAFVVGGDRSDRQGHPVHTHAPGLWMYAVILALGAVAAIVIQAIGYRVVAIQPGLEAPQARAEALRTFQQSMILRFALSEAVAIVAIALLFAGRSNTVLPYVLAAAITELLMAYHVWPSQSLIGRVQERLDRDGGRSELADAINGAS